MRNKEAINHLTVAFVRGGGTQNNLIFFLGPAILLNQVEMKIPNATHPKWLALISEEIKPNIEFLGTKILLSRIFVNYRAKPTHELAVKSINELIQLFETNIKTPKVQDDLVKIFGKEVSL